MTTTSPPPRSPSRPGRRGTPATTTLRAALACLTVGALGAAAVPSGPASAVDARPRATAGSVLLTETFRGSSISDPGFLPLDSVCLTGASGPPPAGESATGPCTGVDQTTPPVPASGALPGWLQLTDNANYRVGGLLYNRPLPGNGGLQVVFDQYQYGGNGADGIGFFLVDGGVDLTRSGADGGSLGYAQRNLVPGVTGGYLGIGLDAYGNFANDGENRGLNCPADRKSPVIGDFQVTDSVTLRGPGNDLDGYCFLAATITPDPSKPAGQVTTLPGSLRADTTDPDTAARRVRLTVSPDPRPLVTVEIDFNDGQGYRQVLEHQMTDPAPRTYEFGFSGSTGGLIDTHLIRNIEASSVDPLSRLNLVKTVAMEGREEIYEVGDTVPYEFLVTNTGETALQDVTVRDPELSDIVCPRTDLGEAGSPTASMVCSGTHVITVNDSFTGEFDNTAIASAVNPGGSAVRSNPSTATVPVERLDPELELSKTATPGRSEPGGTVRYTVTATNAGEVPLEPADFTDDLTRVLDDAAYNDDVTATSGTASVDGETLTWSGDLAPDASATITYSVTTRAARGGDDVLRNAVDSTIPGTRCTSSPTGELPCSVTVPVDRPTPSPTPTPTPTPTPEPSPTPPPEPTPTPTPTETGASPEPSTSPGAPGRPGGLADSGLGTLLLIPGALAAAAAGLLLMWVMRRRGRPAVR